MESDKSIKMSFEYISISSNPGVNKDEYVVIAIFGNEKDTSHEQEGCSWDKDFVKLLKTVLKDNMNADGKKHHGSEGKYYGLGIIHSYNIDDDGSSFCDFASRKGKF
jgi:hypothetical protein